VELEPVRRTHSVIGATVVAFPLYTGTTAGAKRLPGGRARSHPHP
jgi:hypothetical protein